MQQVAGQRISAAVNPEQRLLHRFELFQDLQARVEKEDVHANTLAGNGGLHGLIDLCSDLG